MIEANYSNIPDFDYLASQLDRPTPALKGFESYRRSQFNQQLASNTDPYGGSVKGLTAAYAIQKTRKHGSKPIRVATGKTKDTFQTSVSGNSYRESIGGAAHWQKIQGRLYIPEGELPAKDQDKLLDLFDVYIQRSIRSS